MVVENWEREKMGKKPFTIVFEKSWFEVNDTLNKHYEVVKVYDKI